MVGDEVAQLLPVAFVDLRELNGLGAAAHRVQLELGGQQAPAAVRAEHLIAPLDRGSQIGGGLDAVERAAQRVDLGAEMVAQELDEQLVLGLEVGIEGAPW